MASCGHQTLLLHIRQHRQIVETGNVLLPGKGLADHIGNLIVGRSSQDSIHLRNLLHNLFLIPLGHTAGYNQGLALPCFLKLRHLKDCVYTFLLGVSNEAAGINQDNIRLIFIVCKRVAVLIQKA